MFRTPKFVNNTPFKCSYGKLNALSDICPISVIFNFAKFYFAKEEEGFKVVPKEWMKRVFKGG